MSDIVEPELEEAKVEPALTGEPAIMAAEEAEVESESEEISASVAKIADKSSINDFSSGTRYPYYLKESENIFNPYNSSSSGIWDYTDATPGAGAEKIEKVFTVKTTVARKNTLVNVRAIDANLFLRAYLISNSIDESELKNYQVRAKNAPEKSLVNVSEIGFNKNSTGSEANFVYFKTPNGQTYGTETFFYIYKKNESGWEEKEDFFRTGGIAKIRDLYEKAKTLDSSSESEENRITIKNYSMPNNEGSTKKLKLKVYRSTVNEILKFLRSNRYRKDILYSNCTDWKSFKKGSVNDNIFLIPDNFVFKGGIKYTLGSVTDVTNSGPFKTINNLAGAGAMIDALKNSLKGNGLMNGNIKFQERVNRYRNVPYFKDVDTINIDSLSFTFQYGQFNLYDCEEEVYKPIYQIANIFAPEFEKFNGDTSKDFVATGYDNKFNIMTKMYTNLVKDSGRALAGLLSGDSLNNSSIVDGIKTIPESMAGILNSSANKAATQIIMFSIGSSIYGPYYVSSCNWEFDNNMLDAKGYPYKGTVTLNGIQSLLLEGTTQLISTGGGIFGERY